MKKFLTVLLVIAVMFTFSFSSAFALTEWTGEASKVYLHDATDYHDAATPGHGKIGVTKAEIAKTVADLEDKLDDVEDDYYAPEEESVKALYTAAISDVKAATNSVQIGTIVGTLEAKTDKIKDGYTTAETLIRASDEYIDATRWYQRGYQTNDFVLEGYEFFDVSEANTMFVLQTSGAADDKYVLASDASTPITVADLNLTVQNAVVKYLMDNNYRTATEIKTGLKAMVSSFKVVDDVYNKAVTEEALALQDKMFAYEDKYDDGQKYNCTLTVSDAEGMEKLVNDVDAFNTKYAGYKDVELSAKFELAAEYVADLYFNTSFAEIAALPERVRLADSDKATVIALYNKVTDLADTYADLWAYLDTENTWDEKVLENCVQKYSDLKNAYVYFIDADVDAYNLLDDPEVHSDTNPAYFDSSDANVGKLTAKRAAYNALVADYGYADLDDFTTADIDVLIADEAMLLASEHNKTADAAYDVKDTTKLQNYLNNATLKVTTNALGNTKIRVQARFDTDTYEKIVDECGNDYTISYKFYHKTAKANAFKGPKEKDRNYITYTKLSLKKGVKYKFQCGVVIKDAQGNVVAEKSYKASTTGSRVCR